MSHSTTIPVKERDEADRCRHCGRPTWSLRRCCVPCKRAGRSGAGTIPSRFAERSAGCRLLAVGCFWAAHVAAAVVFGLILLGGIGQRVATGQLPELLALGILESTLDGIGFALAVLLSPRPAASVRPRYLLLAAVTGVACTVLTTAVLALLGMERSDSLPSHFLFAAPIVLTAVIARVCLSVSFANRLLESDAGGSACSVCGEFADEPDEPHCRACGEPRLS